MGNFEITLYRGILSGDIDRNGSGRIIIYRISGIDHRWNYCTYSIEILNTLRKDGKFAGYGISFTEREWW